MKPNIRTRNDKGQYHGYQEHYEHYTFFNDNYILNLRCMAKKDKEIGYFEHHFNKVTTFVIR